MHCSWRLLLLLARPAAGARRHGVPLQPPNPPPVAPSPPVRPPTGDRILCVNFPAVRVAGDELLLNNPADVYDTRLFIAGWVESGGAPLSAYNRTHMEILMQDSAAMGATAFRWNAFLKGLDFEWEDAAVPQPGSRQTDRPHLVRGLKPGCIEAMKDAAVLAAQHGLLLQIVLCTAHFFRWGYGGPDFELLGIKNRQRVVNLHYMLTDLKAMNAYLERVVRPIVSAIGPHPALLGYLLVNEGYSMVGKDYKNFASETDATMTLSQLQRFINRLAGTVRRLQPRALLSASLKLKKNSRWDDQTGKTALALWYTDEALRAAGGDGDGTLDINQYQYYPEGASGIEDSPFLNSAADLRKIHNLDKERKPTLVGEFPLEGIVKATNNPTPFTLNQAYDRLWHLGYSGGFTWMAERFYQMKTAERAAVITAYAHVRKLTGGFRLHLGYGPCPSPPPPLPPHPPSCPPPRLPPRPIPHTPPLVLPHEPPLEGLPFSTLSAPSLWGNADYVAPSESLQVTATLLSPPTSPYDHSRLKAGAFPSKPNADVEAVETDNTISLIEVLKLTSELISTMSEWLPGVLWDDFHELSQRLGDLARQLHGGAMSWIGVLITYLLVGGSSFLLALASRWLTQVLQRRMRFRASQHYKKVETHAHEEDPAHGSAIGVGELTETDIDTVQVEHVHAKMSHSTTCVADDCHQGTRAIA